MKSLDYLRRGNYTFRRVAIREASCTRADYERLTAGQAQMEIDLAAVKTPRKRPRSNRPGALAASGERVLARADGESTGRGVFIVRIYYRSMADEILCFDTAPLTRHAAEQICAIYHGKGTDATDAEIVLMSVCTREPMNCARRVVLPSQMADAPIRLEMDHDDQDFQRLMSAIRADINAARDQLTAEGK